MTSLNRVFLSGYLGNAPEKRTTKAGKEYFYASLASHKSWKKEGSENWEEKTDWHTLFFWSPRAKRLVENLNKGQSLMIDGEIVSFEKKNEAGIAQKSSVIEVKDLKTLAK